MTQESCDGWIILLSLDGKASVITTHAYRMYLQNARQQHISLTKSHISHLGARPSTPCSMGEQSLSSRQCRGNSSSNILPSVTFQYVVHAANDGPRSLCFARSVPGDIRCIRRQQDTILEATYCRRRSFQTKSSIKGMKETLTAWFHTYLAVPNSHYHHR